MIDTSLPQPPSQLITHIETDTPKINNYSSLLTSYFCTDFTVFVIDVCLLDFSW